MCDVEVLSEIKLVKKKVYRRFFQLIDGTKGSGLSFPCDAYGNIDTTDIYYNCWKDNYEYALSHPEKYEDQGVVEEISLYVEPAFVKCSCGKEFYLVGDTYCECGQLYNGFGQALLPPSEWGEDVMIDGMVI